MFPSLKGLHPGNYIWLIVYSCMVSLCNGVASFLTTGKWFSIAEMLRSSGADLLIFAFILLLPVKAAMVAILVLFLPLIVLSLASVLHIAIYKSSISGFSVMSTLETSANETAEFLAEYVTVFTVLIACLTAAVCLFFLWKALKANRKVRRGKGTAIAAVLICAVCGYFIVESGERFLRSSTSYVVVSSVVNYRKDLSMVNEIRQSRANQEYAGVELLDGETDDEETYIFIVGESANRNHMSLYGYHRNTNPELEKLAPELFVFNDVVSASTHTIPSLRQALLFHEGAGDANILHSPSIIGLLRRAGFTTWWLSNQTANSDGLTGTAVIVSDAEHQFFLNRSRSEGHSVSYDEVLLEELEKALASTEKKKAIFLHMIGSHLSYHLRYPSEFNVFLSSEDLKENPRRGDAEKGYVNQYDNSILYTDHIVSRVISMVQAQEGLGLVVYFSDHGQEVYDTLPIRGQDAKHPTRNMFDIPFIVWASDLYEERNPGIVERMRERKTWPFSLAGFADTAAYLSRVTFAGANLSRSWFSPEYMPAKREIPFSGEYDNLPELESGVAKDQ